MQVWSCTMQDQRLQYLFIQQTWRFLFCFQIVRQSNNDQVTVVGAGVTLHEALKAADTLAEAGINIRVVDPFTIKPMDAEALINSAKATGGRIVTVEDHYPEGELI